MSDTELLPKSKPEPVRRLEVFTGTGRRRAWSAEQKARIIAESYESDETVSAVARRHGLTPQQLFGWRRAAERRAEDGAGESGVGICAGDRGSRPAVPGGADSASSAQRIADDRDRDRRCHGSGSAWDRCRDLDDGAARHEGGDMIAVPAGMRVLVATKPVDFRRGADSLAALVREQLRARSVLGNDLHLPLEAGGPPEDPGLGRVRAGAVVEAA